MSTNKVRVSPSKNPWNKKKKTNSKSSPSKVNNAQKKRQQTNSVSQINDTESWPDLKLGVKMNITTAPKKAIEPIQRHSPSNYNNTSGSTPNIKYKPNQNEQDGMHTMPINGYHNTSPFKRSKPKQPITPSKEELNNSVSTSELAKSSNPSSTASTPTSSKKKSTNRRKRKHSNKSSPRIECDANESIPIVCNPQQSVVIKSIKKPEIFSKELMTTSNDSSVISTDSNSKSLTPRKNKQKKSSKDDSESVPLHNPNPIETAQQLQNGLHAQSNGTTHSAPKRTILNGTKHHHSNNPRYGRGRGRGGRGRLRGKRGRGRGRRGGYMRDGYFEENEYGYNRNSYRDNRRGQYRDDRGYGNAPRHNRNQSAFNNQTQAPTTNQPVQYMAVPLMSIQPFPLVQNQEKEIEERKSDTTTTTTNSVTSNANNLESAAIAPTPLLYNPYAINPYLFNPYLQQMEPPDNIHLSVNQMMECPQWSGERPIPMGPYFVLKVSCVATGKGADDRSVGHIALIDWNLKTKANVFVKPEKKIVSYIEPLTSLTPDLLNKYGYSLDAAVNIIKSELPTNAVLIGQNITMDLEWLGLRQSEDFREFIDLRDIWRTWSHKYGSYTHYSLTHQAKYILNDENADKQKHSASADAITTMKLFQYYVWCRYYNMTIFNNKIITLSNTKIEPSFSKKHPVFEGVEMISKKYKGVPYITSNVRQSINKNNEQQKIIINPPQSMDAAKAE